MAAPLDPAFADKVQAIFGDAPFIRELGIVAGEIAPGRVTSSLELAPRHLQQDGFAHAGVVTTLADHTAGACAATLVAADRTVLTSSIVIHLLRPAAGERLVCRAVTLRPGRTLTVVESEVHAVAAGEEKLVAKATVTLAIVDATVGARPAILR